ESSAEAKRAGSLLLHQNRKVFATGNVSIFWIRFDFRKVAQVLEAFLSRLHANRIKDLTWRDKNFAADDFVLRAGVTDNVDSLHKRTGTFFNIVVDVDQSRTGWRAFRGNHKIDIAATAVSVGQSLRIIAQ